MVIKCQLRICYYDSVENETGFFFHILLSFWGRLGIGVPFLMAKQLHGAIPGGYGARRKARYKFTRRGEGPAALPVGPGKRVVPPELCIMAALPQPV